LFLRPSSVEPFILVSAPPVRRAVARLAKIRASKEGVCVRVEAGRSNFFAQDALPDALRGEHVVEETLLGDMWRPCIGQLADEDLHPCTDLPS
jgi:hypothetical protein